MTASPCGRGVSLTFPCLSQIFVYSHGEPITGILAQGLAPRWSFHKRSEGAVGLPCSHRGVSGPLLPIHAFALPGSGEALFPQKGPLLITLDPAFPPERLYRSQASQIAYWELSHLEGATRPVNDLHIILSDVICMMARNDFPLTVPPRWLSELFVLRRAVELKMEVNKWSMARTSKP